jgi:hypothetical protein
MRIWANSLFSLYEAAHEGSNSKFKEPRNGMLSLVLFSWADDELEYVDSLHWVHFDKYPTELRLTEEVSGRIKYVLPLERQNLGGMFSTGRASPVIGNIGCGTLVIIVIISRCGQHVSFIMHHELGDACSCSFGSCSCEHAHELMRLCLRGP